jgi:hypothetical protein
LGASSGHSATDRRAPFVASYVHLLDAGVGEAAFMDAVVEVEAVAENTVAI